MKNGKLNITKLKQVTVLMRYLYILLFAHFTIENVYSQNTPSDYIEVSQKGDCKNGIVQIEVKTNGEFIAWKDASGNVTTISNPTSGTTFVQPDAGVVTYIAEARFTVPITIKNGDFELDTQFFESDYTFVDNNLDQGYFTIGTNPNKKASAYVNKGDHTTGKGKMFIADGEMDDSTKAAYRTFVDVIQGKEYKISFWSCNIHQEFLKANPDTSKSKVAKPQIFVDNKLIAEYTLPPDTSWQHYEKSWVATETKKISVEIKNKEMSEKANDFALDDISMSTTLHRKASISIQACTNNTEPFLSPDGDGMLDTYYIQDMGAAKVIDLDGNIVKEFSTPASWDGTRKNGTVADAGYYAIVVNNDKVYRVSLIR